MTALMKAKGKKIKQVVASLTKALLVLFDAKNIVRMIIFDEGPVNFKLLLCTAKPAGKVIKIPQSAAA
jgi:hypothetical protein